MHKHLCQQLHALPATEKLNHEHETGNQPPKVTQITKNLILFMTEPLKTHVSFSGKPNNMKDSNLLKLIPLKEESPRDVFTALDNILLVSYSHYVTLSTCY